MIFIRLSPFYECHCHTARPEAAEVLKAQISASPGGRNGILKQQRQLRRQDSLYIQTARKTVALATKI